MLSVLGEKLQQVVSSIGQCSYASSRSPTLTIDWHVPSYLSTLLSTTGFTTIIAENDNTDTLVRVSFIPLVFPFWIETFLCLVLQSLFNVLVGIIVWYTMVKDQNPRTSISSTSTRYMVGYGILVPFLSIGPIILFRNVVEFHNVALMFCLAGAVPIFTLLRVLEAVHGQLPDFCYQERRPREDTSTVDNTTTTNNNNNSSNNRLKPISSSTSSSSSSSSLSSFYMLIVYYSAPLQFRFDSKTNQPVPLRRKVLYRKIRSFVWVLSLSSILYSILMPLQYQLLPEQQLQRPWLDPVTGEDYSALSKLYMVITCYLRYLYQPSHLINSYFMALLLSLELEGGAGGLGLIFSILSGFEMEDFSRSPMTKSTSVSDFWGRRWDRPIASALKRGAFRTLRIDAGLSREVAGLAVFALSGLIHEYMLLFSSLRRGNNYDYWDSPTKGRQAAFFVINGLFLVAERLLERTRSTVPIVDQIMTHFTNLPSPLRTIFVILLVLPVGSWFTDEYIQTSFFDDGALGFPLITVERIR